MSSEAQQPTGASLLLIKMQFAIQDLPTKNNNADAWSLDVGDMKKGSRLELFGSSIYIYAIDSQTIIIDYNKTSQNVSMNDKIVGGTKISVCKQIGI